VEHDLFGKPVSTFPDHALANAAALTCKRVPRSRQDRPWQTAQLQAGMKVEIALRNDLEDSPGNESASSMWYGYAIEAIYTVLGTVLAAAVLGILIYH
jgi:hypothetical protein